MLLHTAPPLTEVPVIQQTNYVANKKVDAVKRLATNNKPPHLLDPNFTPFVDAEEEAPRRESFGSFDSTSSSSFGFLGCSSSIASVEASAHGDLKTTTSPASLQTCLLHNHFTWTVKP